MPENHHHDAESHPWEKIYAQDGLVFTEELPHHIFSKRCLRRGFKAFRIHEISYRDEGRILAIWAEKQV